MPSIKIIQLPMLKKNCIKDLRDSIVVMTPYLPSKWISMILADSFMVVLHPAQWHMDSFTLTLICHFLSQHFNPCPSIMSSNGRQYGIPHHSSFLLTTSLFMTLSQQGLFNLKTVLVLSFYSLVL